MTNLAEVSSMLGIVGLLITTFFVLREIQKDLRRIVSAKCVVMFGIGVWYLFEAVAMPDNLSFEMSQDAYDFAMFCVILSIVSFILAYESRPVHFFDSFGRRLRVLDNAVWQWRIFATGLILGSLPILVLGKFDLSLFLDGVFSFQKRWSSPIVRGRYGGLRDAFIELQMFHSAVLPLAAILLLRRDVSMGKRVSAGTFIMWMLLRAMNSGTRGLFFAALLPLLGAVYYRLSEDRKKLAIVVGIPMLGILGYYWSAAVVMTRNSGEFSFKAAEKAEYVGNEMFRELVYINEHIGTTLDYQYGRTYLTQLVNPIPRFIWRNKPTSDAGILLARARGEINKKTGEVYLTRSPGIIGEMYWNFGILGVVLISAFGGLVARAWDAMRLVWPNSPMLFIVHAAGLAILFLAGRSFNMSALYGLIALSLLMTFFGLGPERKNSHRLTESPSTPQPRPMRQPQMRRTLVPGERRP